VLLRVPGGVQTDQVGAAQLQRVVSAVGAINTEAELIMCERCEVDLSHILDVSAYQHGAAGGLRTASNRGAVHAAEQPIVQVTDQQQQQQQQQQQHSPTGAVGEAEAINDGASEAGAMGSHDHDASNDCISQDCQDQGHHHHHVHSHAHGIGTVAVMIDAPLDLPRLRCWLDELLWERGGQGAPFQVLRAKALLHVAGSERKCVLQAVHELYDIVEGPAWGREEVRRSKLVFIGRGLEREALTAEIATCCCCYDLRPHERDL
jgi:G3E family GTPase